MPNLNETTEQKLDRLSKIEEDLFHIVGLPERIEPIAVENFKVLTFTELYKREYPQELFIIDKFIPETGIVMFSGGAGVGKSFMALEVIKAVTTGNDFLGNFAVKKQGVPILVIDKENGLRRLQHRAKGMGIPEADFLHTLEFPNNFSLENKEFVAYIKQYIIDNKIGIVIVDSFIDVLIGKENASEDTTKVFNMLRAIAVEVCWVLLHHESKPPVQSFGKGKIDAVNKARGSGNIAGQVDYLFSISRTKQLKVIQIEQAKARDYGMLGAFEVEFDIVAEEMTGFLYVGEVKDEIRAVDDAMGFIQDFLRNNPNSYRQEIINVGQEEGISSASIGRAIQALKEKNIIDAKQDPNAKNRKLFNLLSDDKIAEIDDNLPM